MLSTYSCYIITAICCYLVPKCQTFLTASKHNGILTIILRKLISIFLPQQSLAKQTISFVRKNGRPLHWHVPGT